MHWDYTPSDIARFWAKVDRNGPIPAHCPDLGPCWVWIAARDRHGYGRLQMGARSTVRAHVMSYEIHHGSLPGGEGSLHRCDNPPCVRPSHLFAGTPSINSRDRDKKGRNPNAFTAGRQPLTYAIGERAGHAKLTEDHVREIRIRKAAGASYSILERDYGLNRASLWEVVHRKTWAHIA